jgi:serine/threonine protein kinase
MIGNRSNFVGIFGRITDHPEGKLGLVLPLLNTHEYSVLGGPPSFDSITRDTFPSDKVFSTEFCFKICHNIASACQYMHSRGILHGDVYAHNILTKADGDCLLTDFGASTIISDVLSKEECALLEKIEVRAYGCLIDDLLIRIDSAALTTEEDKQQFQQLKKLSIRCLSDPSLRPGFSEIVDLFQH